MLEATDSLPTVNDDGVEMLVGEDIDSANILGKFILSVCMPHLDIGQMSSGCRQSRKPLGVVLHRLKFAATLSEPEC